MIFGLNLNSKNDPILNMWTPSNDVAQMPIVLNTKPNPVQTCTTTYPTEERDEKFIKFLSPSVKITVNGASGSGTICHYDSESNWAYIISCGHLWQGNKSYDKLEKKQKAKITIWYHNNQKLTEPKVYDAEILFWSNTRGYDCSCLRFQPDWTPDYFPIAEVDYKFKKGDVLNSLGCDGGKEVARYEVEFLEMRGMDIITMKNSPRPGRSGGGLLTDSKQYVGICWGTSDTSSGNGIGYFTPLLSIHKVFKDNDHEWLLKLIVRKFIIKDWENPNKKYDNNYIPMPMLLL